MDDSGLCLFGSRPPSVLEGHRPFSRTNDNILDDVDLSLYRTPTPSTPLGNKHKEGSSLSAHKLNNKTYSSPTPNTPKKKSAVYKFPYQQSQDDQADSKKKKRHQSSYVDETLFGEEHPVVADFPAPWESQHYKHDQVKGRYHRTALPHTTANRHVPRKHYYGVKKTDSSFVDETLFGEHPQEADFPAPWETKSSRKPKQYVMDSTDYRAKQQDEQLSQRSIRSATPNSSRSQRPGSGRKIFKNSFVDETLFGSPLEEAQFDAPWQDKIGKKTRPLIFDGGNTYKVAGHSSNGDSPVLRKPCKVSVSIRRPSTPQRPSSAKPAWK